MLGCSRTKHEVFVLPANYTQEIHPEVQVETKLLRLDEVRAEQWRQLVQLQGRFVVSYLRFRYGAADTRLLLAFVGGKFAHVQWIVPAYKLKSRYYFIPDDSYSIISCMTAETFRGLSICPSQIQKVTTSEISTESFLIWAESTNVPSLRGIRKAGGIKVGEFIKKKWLWGCICCIEYFSEGSDLQ